MAVFRLPIGWDGQYVDRTTIMGNVDNVAEGATTTIASGSTRIYHMTIGVASDDGGAASYCNIHAFDINDVELATFKFHLYPDSRLSSGPAFSGPVAADVAYFTVVATAGSHHVWWTGLVQA